MAVHTVNLNEARMMVKGEDGEWIALTGPAEDRFTFGDPKAFMAKMVVTIKAESEVLNRILEVAHLHFHGEPMCLFTRLAIALRKLGHHQVRVRPAVMLG